MALLVFCVITDVGCKYLFFASQVASPAFLLCLALRHREVSAALKQCCCDRSNEAPEGTSARDSIQLINTGCLPSDVEEAL